MLQKLIPRKFHHLCPEYQGYVVIAVKPNEAYVEPKRAAKRLRKGLSILIYANQWLKEVIGDDELTVCPIDITRLITRILEVLGDRNAAWNVNGEKMRPANVLMDCFGGVYGSFNELQDAIKHLTGTPIYIALSSSTLLKLHSIVDRIRSALCDLLRVLQGMTLRKKLSIASLLREDFPLEATTDMINQADEDAVFSLTLSNRSLQEINMIRRCDEGHERRQSLKLRCVQQSLSTSTVSYSHDAVEPVPTIPTTLLHIQNHASRWSTAATHVDAGYRPPKDNLSLSADVPADLQDSTPAIGDADSRFDRPTHRQIAGHRLEEKPVRARELVAEPFSVFKNSSGLDQVDHVAGKTPKRETASSAEAHYESSQQAMEDVLVSSETDARSRRSRLRHPARRTRRDLTLKLPRKSSIEARNRIKVTYPKLIPARAPPPAVDTSHLIQKLHELQRSSSYESRTTSTDMTLTDQDLFPDIVGSQPGNLPESELLDPLRPLSPTLSMTRSFSRLSCSTAVTDSQSPVSFHFSDWTTPPVQDDPKTIDDSTASWVTTAWDNGEGNNERSFHLDKSRRFSLSHLANLQRRYGSRLEDIKIKASRGEMSSHSCLASEIVYERNHWRFVT